MINEAHAKAGHHHNYLRRAVAPNLFTSTLHPEFLPALVMANLMTPCLWDWAKKSVTDVSKPVEALHEIHRFMNKRFHHARGDEFAAIWGLQEGRHLTDPDEREASEYAMQLMERCSVIKGNEIPWLAPLVPLLRDGLFPLYVYSTADLLRAHGKKIGKRMLGLTSCVDECVLAASLAVAAGVCRWEDVVFLGSPMHYTVFFLTTEGTVWFNAKREIFTSEGWEEVCAGHDQMGRLAQLDDRLIIADRLICGDGATVVPRGQLTGRRGAVTRAKAEVEKFARVAVPWLHPLPEKEGDHIFNGWEVLEAGRAGGASGVERAVLERALKGGAPMLEAALYMFRHPEFCHPEVLRRAAKKGFYAYLRASSVGSIEEIHALVDAIPGRESFYGSGGRMAMPDEVLAFGMASEAEREMLKVVLKEHFAGRA